MMTQFEGPVVDSLWEAFIISWHARIAPLNCTQMTASETDPPTYQLKSFNELVTEHYTFRLPESMPTGSILEEHMGGNPHYDADIAGQILRLHAKLLYESQNSSELEAISHHLSKPIYSIQK